MFVRTAAIVLLCLGVPPPALSQGVPPPPTPPAVAPAPWDPSPAPFLLEGELIPVDADQRIGRALVLTDHSGFDVQAGRTLHIDSPISTDPDVLHGGTQLWKLGAGHLALSDQNTYRGNTVLLQGSLGLASDQALGQPGNALDQYAGTRLELADGVTIDQALQIHAADAYAPIPPSWTVPTLPATPPDPGAAPPAPAAPVPPTDPAAVIRVASGLATWQGFINAQAPIVKDGAGTLRLAGYGFGLDPQPLRLREGGLRVDGAWVGAIRTDPGTVLSGSGWVDQAQVGGWLQPGAPDAVGTFSLGQHLQLDAGAHTRIRIDASGAADQLWSQGTARLGGALWVDATPGAWTPQTRWTIVQADQGLDLDPSGTPGHGRFTQVHGTLRYLDPVVFYEPTQAILGWQYNARGLNTADASWRAALFDDSRFLRDAALAHTASGRPWLQSWAANTTRPASQGLPGDDRDTGGVQLGISRALAPGWHGALFAGYQASTLDGDHVKDQAFHIGLAASRLQGRWRLTAGAAHAWHRADVRRQADVLEPSLDSRARAGLSQLWLAAEPAEPYALGAWELAPHAHVAWLRLHRNSVQEAGGLAAVDLAAQTDTRWWTQPGLRVQRRWPTAHGDAILAVDLGLRSLWGGQTLHSPQAYQGDPAQTFEASGQPMARHALRLDVGVQAPIARRVRLGLAYTGQHGSGQHQHGAWLKLSLALDGAVN